MAHYRGDDSSDDDFSDNLQLAERLRINRDKTSNCRKKNFLDDQSSSSSFEMQSDAPKDSSARKFGAFNKKRQNGDKSVEFFANPKRTCLSNRYLKSPDNQNKKKSRTEHYHNTDFPCSSSGNTSKHIYADKTYEDHLHNLAKDENPVLNSKQISKKFLSCLKEHPKEDLASAQPKQHNDQNKQSKMKCSSNSLKHFPWRDPQNNLGEHSMSTNIAMGNELILRRRPIYGLDSPRNSEGSVVHYVESASDDDSRSMIKSGALKGGRQSPEISQSNRKVVGRKVKKKVLDSDLDSDDDVDDWPTNHRTRPRLLFSSSDSEIESDRKTATKPSVPPEISDTYLFPDTTKNNLKSVASRSRPSPRYSRDNSVAGPSSSPISYSKSPRSFRSIKQIRTNTNTESSPNSFPSNNVGRRGRSRANMGERCTRRSSSPHPRTLPNSHSRMTRAEAAKSGKGRSLTGSVARGRTTNFAAMYPDLFDPEDSSEVEFFTANSYSDTETSAESFGGLTISSAIRSADDSDVFRSEHSVNIGSSEDEICVVYSSLPSNGELDRQAIRSSEPRRTLGRRRQRGSWRHRHDPVQEVVSLSPDPVEQVRQVEDDERFARTLQAQFDAEVDPDYSPSPQPTTPPRPMPFSPFDIASHVESDLRGVDFSSWGGFREFHQVLPFHQDWRGGRFNRGPHRDTPSNFFGNIFYNNRRLDRAQRRRPSGPATINRLFEMGMFNAFDDIYSDDSFETFLGIAELNGDVPRGLQKSEINRLPTRQYIIANNSAGPSNELPHKRAGLNKECQVCLTDYESGDTLRILPCFHEFHTPCIDPWLKINHTCPVCRVVVDLEG